MSRVEDYWRAGYTVEGGVPVVVEAYGRSKEHALKAAQPEGVAASRGLADSGIEASVNVWVEHYRLVTSVERIDDGVEVIQIIPAMDRRRLIEKAESRHEERRRESAATK